MYPTWIQILLTPIPRINPRINPSWLCQWDDVHAIIHNGRSVNHTVNWLVWGKNDRKIPWSSWENLWFPVKIFPEKSTRWHSLSVCWTSAFRCFNRLRRSTFGAHAVQAHGHRTSAAPREVFGKRADRESGGMLPCIVIICVCRCICIYIYIYMCMYMYMQM